ncbi:MAG TPA: LD-carboxypeptidase [Gemmatimonadaceae bacterium]|nr:LD-carboxypeptidase [Gemmatimonadaceae bacterium]
MRAPPPLDTGARVALIAPAGPLRDEAELETAINSVRSLGWEPAVGAHVLERDGYLAGSDERRLADLDRFARDDTVAAIWCIRGGYGAMRLLDRLDYDAWRRRPKALIGFSDVTALHCAIGRAADLVTFHGPTARATLSPFSRTSLVEAVCAGASRALLAPAADILHGGRGRGHVTGGNLAIVAALLGTPFAPNFDGAILVLEDVNEAVYRIDRMLTQLRLSGALDRLRGIAFGHFTDVPAEPDDHARPLAAVLGEFAGRCGIPCLANIPLGHIHDQWTLPLGAAATLDADARTLVME